MLQLPLPDTPNTTCFLFTQVDPADPEAWFTSYANLLLPVARLAESLGVHALAVGIELELFVAKEEERWRSLIKEVRKVFSGSLTYGSEPLRGETSKVPFWDALDFIGVDLYLPVVDPFKRNASLVVTREEMASTFESLLQRFVLNWYWKQKNLSRKIVVMEIGYPSSNKGMRVPWKLPDEGHSCSGDYAANFTAQSTAFEVALQSIGKHSDVFAGVLQFWTGVKSSADFWEPGTVIGAPDSQWGCGWNVQGKSSSITVFRNAFGYRAPAPPPAHTVKPSITLGYILGAVAAGSFAGGAVIVALVAYYFHRRRQSNVGSDSGTQLLQIHDNVVLGA